MATNDADAQESATGICAADDGGERESTIRFTGLGFEVKLDGDRAITVFDDGGKRVTTPNGKNLTLRPCHRCLEVKATL